MLNSSKLDFIETVNGFEATDIKFENISFDHLLVKAHEKEIYDFGDYIIAKPHNDNERDYEFSKVDFLSHKLLELIYGKHVPKLYAASFADDTYFILEKLQLDPLHKAYNVFRQGVHKKEGLDYKYDPQFLAVDNVMTLVEEHRVKVDDIQEQFKRNLEIKGITFDHSHVNITWRNDEPVFLEVHKGRKDYLFDYDRCFRYVETLENDRRELGLLLLNRIKVLL